MTLQQPGTGYRDPAKALTIKALQDRAKKAAEFATASTTIQSPIADPLQGISHLTGVLSGQVQQGRADAQEADARGRLAGIMSGIDPEKGASMAQIAEMQQLDPDFANKIYEQMMADRQANLNREDTQTFTAGENTLTRQAEADRQAALFGQQDKTASTLATTQETAAIADDTRSAQQKIEDDKRAAAEKRAEEAAAAGENRRQEAARTPDAEIYAAYEAGNLGGPAGSPEAIAARDAALGKAHASAHSAADSQSPGIAEMNKKFAPDVLDWDTVGGANAVKSVTQVNKALELLKTGNTTGFQAGVAEGILPEVVNKWWNPDGTIARDAIRDTVQQTLRATLGAQFTQQEGEALMNRAFDINLDEKENIRRAQLLLTQIQTIGQNKAAMVDYFKKNGGNLDGYTGPPVDLTSLVNIDLGDGPGGMGGGGGGGGGTPDDPLGIR